MLNPGASDRAHALPAHVPVTWVVLPPTWPCHLQAHIRMDSNTVKWTYKHNRFSLLPPLSSGLRSSLQLWSETPQWSHGRHRYRSRNTAPVSVQNASDPVSLFFGVCMNVVSVPYFHFCTHTSLLYGFSCVFFRFDILAKEHVKILFLSIVSLSCYSQWR